MRYFFISFLFVMVSCQTPAFIEDWISFLKDETLTELASQSTRGALTEEQRAQLFILFLDIEETQNCSQLVRLIENNELLEDHEEEYNLKKGFLFDIFNGYTHETIVFSGLDLSQKTEQLAWIISNAWKTKFSIARINSVLADLTYCYPY